MMLWRVVTADALTDASVAPAAAVAWRDTLVVVGRAVDLPQPVAGTQLVTRVKLDQDAGGRDLGDLLASVAGLQVRRYGGLGSSVVPSIRGSAGAQVRLFIDGLPLESAETGFVDVARLPLDRFSDAEVYRGVVPSGFGGLGGAGAVNLLTRRPEGGMEARGFVGSFGDRGGRATWASGSADGRRSLLVMAHARRIDNDFPYRDHRQTFNRTDDDTTRVRTNAHWRDWGAWTAGTWESGPLTVQGGAGAYRKEGGRPGPAGALSPTAAVRSDRQDGRLSFGWRDNLVRLDLAAARTEEFLYDHQGEVQPGFRGVIQAVSEDLTGRLTWSATLARRAQDGLLNGLDLSLTGETRRQWFRQSYNAAADPRRNRTTTAVAAEATLRAAGGRVRLVPAWRWQQSVDDFPPLPPLFYLDQEGGVRHLRADGSPSLGVSWEIRPGTLFLEGHLTRTVRQPTWVELFGHRGGVAGNRELQPEKVESADLDLTWRPADLPLGARLAAFAAQTGQAVIYVQNSPGTSRPVNAGATGTRGLELEVWGDAPAGFGWSLNGTWQQARDRSDLAPYDGKELPFLPAGEWWGGLHRQTGAWRPFLTICGEGPNFRDRANTPQDRAPARAVLSIGIGRWWRPRWLGPGGNLAVTMEAINLTDNDIYDVEGFPLPGRSWHAGVHIQP